MTRGLGLQADEYGQVAAEEAELAKKGTSNEARAQHYPIGVDLVASQRSRIR